MKSFAILIAGLCLASLAACGGGGGSGGGGGGGGGTISISPTSLQFTQDGGTYPPTQDVTVTFNGAGVAAGFKPGDTQPPWLFISNPVVLSTTQIRFTITAQALTAVPAATYKSSIRFATGTSLSNPTGYVDLPVSFTYREAFSVVPSANPLQFAELAGNPGATTPASEHLAIAGSGINWQITATQPWIKLSATSGTGAATVDVSVARPSLPPGVYQGEIDLTNDRDTNVAKLPVTYTVTAAQLVLDKSSLSFTVDASTTTAGLSSSISISDDLQGQSGTGDLSWHATADVPWLVLSASSGRTSPATMLGVSISATQLEQLPPAYYGGTVSITATDRAGQSRQYSIPVTFNLLLPFVRAVVPNFIAANSATSLRITGEGLDPATYPDMRVGTQAPQNIHQRFVLPSEALFDLPAQSVGQYVVTFVNALGLTRSDAIVNVSSAAPPSPGVIVSAGTKSRLIYDQVRQRLYAVNPGAGRIDRFAWNASTSTWDTMASVTLAGVVDAALERSNRDLIAITDTQMFRIALDAASPVPAAIFTLGDTSCGRSLFQIGVMDVEQALVTLIQKTCPGGVDPPVIFDLVRDVPVITSPVNIGVAAGVVAISSREFGNFIGAAQPMSPNVFFRIDSLSDYLFSLYFPVSPAVVRALDVDATAAVTLVNNDTVAYVSGYDASADVPMPAPIGRVARLGGYNNSIVRIYSYVYPPAGSRHVDVRNLNGNGFTDLGPISIADDLGDAARDADLSTPDTLAMTPAIDEHLLFLSGPSRIVVLSTPP